MGIIFSRLPPSWNLFQLFSSQKKAPQSQRDVMDDQMKIPQGLQNEHKLDSKYIKQNQINTIKTQGISKKQRIEGKSKQNNITNENLDQKINEASQRNGQQAIKLLNKISNFIKSTGDKSFTIMQKYAFVQTSLAQLCFSNGIIKDCEQHEDKALGFYKQFQSEFFQEMVFLLNNKALRNQKNNQLDQAIKIYKYILELQKKYYDTNDVRRLLLMNNLACALCLSEKKDQGLKILYKIEEKIKSLQQKDKQTITKLIEKNIAFYKDR